MFAFVSKKIIIIYDLYVSHNLVMEFKGVDFTYPSRPNEPVLKVSGQLRFLFPFYDPYFRK